MEKKKKRKKINKFVLLVMLCALFTASIGVSTWLVTKEISGTPTYVGQVYTTTISLENDFVRNGQIIPSFNENGFRATVYNPLGEAVCSTNALYYFTWKYADVDENGDTVENYSKLTDGVTSISVTFTPSSPLGADANKYSEVTQTFDVTMPAVAYINSTDNSYGTVEGALIAANSGDKVYVIPSNTAINPYVVKGCTIKEGVSLTLPYDGQTWEADQSGKVSVFADQTSTNLKTILTVNATIKNEGIINIGGILGNTTQGIAGQTSGSYSQITMLNNGKIDSTGEIYCRGFIKNAPSNTSKGVILNSGTLKMPFVIYDFRGGTCTAGLWNGKTESVGNDKIAPFMRYDLPNVQCYMQMFSSAAVKTYADLYATVLGQGQHNKTEFNMYASSNAVYNLNSGAYLESTYTPLDADGNASNYTTQYGITNMKITGGADLGSLSMSVSGVDISMSECRFPIPFNFNITFSNGEYNFGYRTKLMSGAKLLVEENAKLNISKEMIIYPKSTQTASEENANVFYDDNTTVASSRYPARETAQLQIKGTVNASALLTGLITASGNNAMLTLTKTGSITSYEATASGGFLGSGATITPYDTITNSATGDLYNTSNTSLHEGKYFAVKTDDNIYEWFGNGAGLKINYVLDNNNLVEGEKHTNPALLEGASLTLSNATSDSNLSFTGWYFDLSNENSKISTLTFDNLLLNYLNVNDGSITLYAGWENITMFTVSFDTNNTNYSDIAITAIDVRENQIFNPYTYGNINNLITAKDNDFDSTDYFVSWYYYDGEKVKHTIDSSIGITVTSNITLLAEWKTKTKINISVQGSSGFLGIGKKSSTLALTYNGKSIENVTSSSGTKTTATIYVKYGYELQLLASSSDNSPNMTVKFGTTTVTSYFVTSDVNEITITVTT